MKASIAALMLCALLALAGCGDDDSSGTTEGTDTTAAVAASGGSADDGKPKVTVPDGAAPTQLLMKDLTEGSGPAAKRGDNVTVEYVGVGFESGKEFDTSWGREPFAFQLGSGQVIPGWEEGVVGMKAGGRRQLLVPPELAYGEAGFPPSIAPNEALVFVIDLLEIG